MNRCNELCTKDATGTCAVCEALAERDRFLRFWFQGGLFVEGVHAMQRRGVFALLHRHALPLALLSLVGLVLWLTWYAPYRFPGWRSTASYFFTEHPLFVIALGISVVCLLFWLLFWKLPQRQVAAVPEVKDRVDLESKARQTMAQIVGGAALLGGLYFTYQTVRTSQETLRTTQDGQIAERFTKAIDQLGRDNLAMRLARLYPCVIFEKKILDT